MTEKIFPWPPAMQMEIVEREGSKYFKWVSPEGADHLAKVLRSPEVCGGETVRVWRGNHKVASATLMHVGGRETDEPYILSQTPGRYSTVLVNLDGPSIEAARFEVGDELFLWGRLGKIPTPLFGIIFWSAMTLDGYRPNAALYFKGLYRHDQDEHNRRPSS